MTLEMIEDDVRKELSQIAISKDMHRWMLTALFELNEDDTVEQKEQQRLKKQKTELENRLHGLVNMRADGEIESEQFQDMKRDAEQKIQDIEMKLATNTECESVWRKVAKDYINFAFRAPKSFGKVTKNEKTQIVTKLASNLTLQDKKLCISTRKSLTRIKECATAYATKKGSFEPKNRHGNNGDSDGFALPISFVRAELKAIRTCILDETKSDYCNE